MDEVGLNTRQKAEAAIAVKFNEINNHKAAILRLRQDVRKMQKALDAGLYDGLD